MSPGWTDCNEGKGSVRTNEECTESANSYTETGLVAVAVLMVGVKAGMVEYDELGERAIEWGRGCLELLASERATMDATSELAGRGLCCCGERSKLADTAGLAVRCAFCGDISFSANNQNQ